MNENICTKRELRLPNNRQCILFVSLCQNYSTLRDGQHKQNLRALITIFNENVDKTTMQHDDHTMAA